MSKKQGRPAKYTKQLANEICTRLAEGESLLRICRDNHMPHRATVHYWLLDEDKKEFYDKYEKARNAQAEAMFEELLDIADDGTNDYMEGGCNNGEIIEVVDKENIQRSRLRVDTRKWFLSKVLPKKFGDKLDLTTEGEKVEGVNVNIVSNESDRSSSDSSLPEELPDNK